MLKFNKFKHEAIIDGKKVPYDACGSGKLEDSLEFYKDDYEFIGSTKTLVINDTEVEDKEPVHVFKKKIT